MKVNKIYKIEIEGYLGGNYEKLGFYDDERDASRGLFPTEKLDDLLEDFKERKVKITVEVIE